MRDRTIVTLVPRDTTPVRLLDDGTDGELAPVIPLRSHEFRGNRVIHPVDAPPGIVLGTHGDMTGVVGDRDSEPGPLARALMAMADG